MEELIRDILRDQDVFVPLLMGTVGVVAIGCSTFARVVVSTARERTKREIAAYIAEGAITPEQAERIIASGGRKGCC